MTETKGLVMIRWSFERFVMMMGFPGRPDVRLKNFWSRIPGQDLIPKNFESSLVCHIKKQDKCNTCTHKRF